uniref:Muscular LMNA interacting protein n=1 Tax=Apteryx owenii TaxID=8824 RepID=A0A8B9QGK1_APTOW
MSSSIEYRSRKTFLSLCLLQSNTVSDELALKSGARQDSVHPVRTDSSQKIFQPPSCNSNRGEMQANDLFKAEFILITDSGEEDEVATASNSAQQAPNGYRPISARLLAASHVSAGGEAKKPPDDLHGSSRSQRVHTYSPIFTCQSYALLSSPSQSGMVSPTLEKHSSPSPSLSHSTSRSKSDSSHKSNQELSASSPTPSNVSKQTKPGVIRPVLVKGKSTLKKEEPYQPNPFKKYLEEISDQDTEQVSDSHFEVFLSLCYFL